MIVGQLGKLGQALRAAPLRAIKLVQCRCSCKPAKKL